MDRIRAPARRRPDRLLDARPLARAAHRAARRRPPNSASRWRSSACTACSRRRRSCSCSSRRPASAPDGDAGDELGRRRALRGIARGDAHPAVGSRLFAGAGARGLIENALRVAGSAPSGANQQPWTFVVVTDDDTKQRIRDGAEHEEQLLYDERATEEYLQAIEPIGTDAVEAAPHRRAVLIAVFEQPWRFENGEKHKHYYVRESVGIAVGFLLTALHLSGLATLTHAPSPMGFLREILDRPENERPFLLLPVGYPAADARCPTSQEEARRVRGLGLVRFAARSGRRR